MERINKAIKYLNSLKSLNRDNVKLAKKYDFTEHHNTYAIPGYLYHIIARTQRRFSNGFTWLEYGQIIKEIK